MSAAVASRLAKIGLENVTIFTEGFMAPVTGGLSPVTVKQYKY